MPFTTEQFFAVFGTYNEAVWPMQWSLLGLALGAVALVPRGGTTRGRLIAAVLAFLWVWMGIAYHLAFFTAINPAAWLFGVLFSVQALLLLRIGVIGKGLRFGFGTSLRHWTAMAMLVYALGIYPVLGFALGHRYPQIPTFGLPCPTTIFTLAMLLLATAPPRSLFIVPLLWAAVGSTAAFQLGVLQDLGLLAAGAIALVVLLTAPRNCRPASLRLR